MGILTLALYSSFLNVLSISFNDQAGPTVILYTSPSVHSQALGNSGVAYVTNDFYPFNPASLSLAGGKSAISLDFYPAKAKWPDQPKEEVGFTYFGGSITLPLFKSDKRSITGGIAYSFYKFRFEDYVRTSETSPDPLGFEELFERLHGVTIAVSHNAKFQFGTGFKFKYFTSKRIARGGGIDKSEGVKSSWLVDWGILVRTNQVDKYKSTDSKLHVLFTPAFGVSFLNIGPNLSYKSAFSEDSPPTIIRIGTSATLETIKNRITHLSFTPIIEMEHLFPSGGITQWHFAGEVGFWKIVYVQSGLILKEGASKGHGTWGFSIESHGLTEILSSKSNEPEKNTPPSVFDTFMFSFYFAKYLENEDFLLQQMRFLGMSISVNL